MFSIRFNDSLEVACFFGGCPVRIGIHADSTQRLHPQKWILWCKAVAPGRAIRQPQFRRPGTAFVEQSSCWSPEHQTLGWTGHVQTQL